MRKYFTTLLLSLSAVVLLTATSCTREYLCQCKITYTGAPGLPQGVVTEYPITDSKKNARNACQAASGTYNSGGIQTVEECDLF